MADTRSQQIATLLDEIGALEAALQALASMPAAQAPLHVQLAEKRRQLAALSPEPRSGGGTIYQTGGVNFGSGNSIGISGDIIGGDKVAGDKVAGDKIGGDKISVGDISNSSGVAIGRSASAYVGGGAQLAGGPLGAPASALFQRIYRQIEALPEDTDIQADLKERVRQIELEVDRGRAAELPTIEHQLTVLARLSPEIFSVTAAALVNPLAGTPATVRDVVARVRAGEDRA